mmetsp:Transcript_31347/g.94174  ORF Transcript_31347/g.94174 Transcript_31347/m.94174 type:complete len:241 (-) Transcript_31347:194-916(-)
MPLRRPSWLPSRTSQTFAPTALESRYLATPSLRSSALRSKVLATRIMEPRQETPVARRRHLGLKVLAAGRGAVAAAGQLRLKVAWFGAAHDVEEERVGAVAAVSVGVGSGIAIKVFHRHDRDARVMTALGPFGPGEHPQAALIPAAGLGLAPLPAPRMAHHRAEQRSYPRRVTHNHHPGVGNRVLRLGGPRRPAGVVVLGQNDVRPAKAPQQRLNSDPIIAQKCVVVRVQDCVVLLQRIE